MKLPKISIYDRLTHRCCHACSQGLKVDDGAFHTNAQILACASICDVCCALAESVLVQRPSGVLPYCGGDYIFLNRHDKDWKMAKSSGSKAGYEIPVRAWRYAKSIDGSGICVKRVSF